MMEETNAEFDVQVDEETKSLMDQGLIPRSASVRNTVLEKPPAQIHDRITVVETISFTSMDGDRVRPVESKYWYSLSLNDRPYQRSYKVGEDAVPLDMGWAKEWAEIGLIHVSNDMGKRRSFAPTPAELEEDERRVLELGDWLIPAGRSMRGYHKDPSQLLIRSQCGVIPITVTVYPA